jgi:hypothetical protein
MADFLFLGIKMILQLPTESGMLEDYKLVGQPLQSIPVKKNASRVIFSAAHVVADPMSRQDPSGPAAVDWTATLAFRRYLAGLGLGIAEAMDTAQRGMGLDWNGALELIRQTKAELPNSLVMNGAGTDHLLPQDARSLDDVISAYLEQIDAIQKLDGRVIIMASRALAQIARGPTDYAKVYDRVLAACDAPVILHWLGEMFDPALAGYWGGKDFEEAMDVALGIINENIAKVDGIKISFLDKDKEIIMRRRLPEGAKMYTGDDFNYPELMAGDSESFSHALLGIFDPLASAIGGAMACLDKGDHDGFRAALDPTVPLARLIFRAPTQYYKTGVVFLAWLNGHQDHFIMLNGAQAMRPLPYFADVFRLADQNGLFQDTDLATARMKNLLELYGVA